MYSYCVSLPLLLSPITNAYVLCPYCDPNYDAYPNLNEACRGYDVPMGNPVPVQGKSDPGIRNQIFSSMYRNPDGHYALNDKFITANVMIKCDASWSSEVYDNFEQYVNGKIRSSTTGYGIQATPHVDVSGKPAGGIEIESSIPSLFSRDEGTSNNVAKTRDFFAKERGSIALTEAVCISHRVDISDKASKVFTEPFEQNVITLFEATFGSKGDKLKAFKHFVNEFGTHYAAITELGTKLSVERRYSAKERATSGANEIEECNTLVGSQIFGFQVEMGKHNCTKQHLMDRESDSQELERTVISTYGSFIASSLIDWTKQVVTLVQNEAFYPHPIRRELRPIVLLFTEKNFAHLKFENTSVNATLIIPWITDLYTKYCDIFSLVCNITGCGIDDKCGAAQFCSDSGHTAEYSCGQKVSEIFMKNGHKYFGEINEGEIPNGHGVSFFLSRPDKVEYEGSWVLGKRSGTGKIYFPDGSVKYDGNLTDGMVDGYGTHYYGNGNIMFQGIWKLGELYNGKLFSEDGGLLTDYGGT